MKVEVLRQGEDRDRRVQARPLRRRAHRRARARRRRRGPRLRPARRDARADDPGGPRAARAGRDDRGRRNHLARRQRRRRRRRPRGRRRDPAGRRHRGRAPRRDVDRRAACGQDRRGAACRSSATARGSSSASAWPDAGARQPGKAGPPAFPPSWGAFRMSRRILVVEDDDDTRDYLAKALRESGYTVEATASGREGLMHALGGELRRPGPRPDAPRPRRPVAPEVGARRRHPDARRSS